MNIFKRKLLGVNVKYSKNTARENPYMVLNEFMRKIDRTNISIKHFETRLANTDIFFKIPQGKIDSLIDSMKRAEDYAYASYKADHKKTKLTKKDKERAFTNYVQRAAMNNAHNGMAFKDANEVEPYTYKIIITPKDLLIQFRLEEIQHLLNRKNELKKEISNLKTYLDELAQEKNEFRYDFHC